MHLTVWITILTFLATLGFILWRPRGINEAIPATIGAMIVILSGSVSLSDLVSLQKPSVVLRLRLWQRLSWRLF